MEYTALYRKYRPKNFTELVGQKHISSTLLNAINTNRVSHAYIFCGPRGTGKTSVAHIMSRAVNCLNLKDGEPCGECEACKRIQAGLSMDILEMDAASKRGIDDMRDLLDKVKYAPVQEKYKVYIVDEVHMLTNESFNAFLKTLEEPPENVIFILATTEAHKVPVTILSRCQRYDFHRVSDGEIAEHLMDIASKEGREITEEGARLIARRSEGGLRDAIGLLDQSFSFTKDKIDSNVIAEVLGTAPEEQVARVAHYVAVSDIKQTLEEVEKLSSEGRDLRQFLQQLLEYLREQIILSASGKPVQIEQNRVLQMMRDLVDADQKMRTSGFPRISLEIALLNAARLGGTPAPNLVRVEAKSEVQAENKVAEPVRENRSRPQMQENNIPEGISRELRFILENWNQILMAVKKQSVVASAFLQQGKPVKYADGVLYLEFGQKFSLHMERIMEEPTKSMVENVFSKICQSNVEIQAKIV